MPRSATEIQAEIDAIKATGVHPASKLLRPLRDELKALSPAPATQSPPAPGASEPPTTSDVASAVVAPPSGAEASTGTFGSSPSWGDLPPAYQRWDREEKFIDAVLCHVAAGLDFKGGSMSGVVEKIYERVDAVVKCRRIIVEVLDTLEPGQRWPQFNKTNRNPNTGELRLLVSEAPFQGEELPKSAPPAAAPVTEAGMPVRAARPSKNDILNAVLGGGVPVSPVAGIKQGLMAELSSRPEPARAKGTATG